MNGYDAVMGIPAEDEFSLAVCRACHGYVSESATADIPVDKVMIVAGDARRRLPGQPGLRLVPLLRYGVPVKAMESTRGGHRGYYRMPDPDGVDRALRERGF